MKTLPDFLVHAGMPKITPGRNMSDYALEVISNRGTAGQQHKQSGSSSAEGGEVDVEKGEAGGLVPLSQIFMASQFGIQVKKTLTDGLLTKERAAAVSGLLREPHKRPGTWVQLYELTRRFWQTSLRNRDSLYVRYFVALVFGFIVGTVFVRVGVTQSEGPKKLSVIFFTVGHFLFSSSSFFPPIFMNRVLYFREHSGNMYSAGTYFVARFLGDLPHILAEVFLTTLLVYFVSGLNSEHHSSRYGYFFWACVTLRIAAIFMTQVVASVIAAPDFAFSVLATIMYLMFALSGFFIPFNDIPKWWQCQ